MSLADGTEHHSRAIVIATAVQCRRLPLDRWADFEGSGIYYAATELEVNACRGRPVTVICGANSAGQAALFLASQGCPVTLAVRLPVPTATMSAYLQARLDADPRISVHPGTEVSAIHGQSTLERITLTNISAEAHTNQACSALFCFIGTQPATGWLGDIDLDQDGLIRTDVQLDPAALGPIWAGLRRNPALYETSIPAVLAVGDVRSGSTKRVATAVGKGAAVIRFVHNVIGTQLGQQ